MAKIYKYPSDIQNAEASYLSFTIMRHKGKVLTEKLRTIDETEKLFDVTAEDIIALPMPNNFSDTLSINYSNLQDLNTLSGSLKENIEKVGKNLLNAAGGTSLSQVGEFAQQGKAFGIQSALMFDNVNIKNHDFTWELIPESYEEAVAIENIIKTLTLSSLPFSNAKIGYNFPDIIKLRMKGVNSSLVKFLPMVITSVSYTPTSGGYFQIYSDGLFPTITFSISFSEIVTRTREMQDRIYNKSKY